ncbi:MAG: hypothetical protein J3Q66DRAFT_362600 [Benniella sp.]|nr:MAG: hypothetical protein J3Q66DRAFT_362600 [Benniella sp.]
MEHQLYGHTGGMAQPGLIRATHHHCMHDLHDLHHRYTKPPRTTPSQSDPMTGHLPPDEKELKQDGHIGEVINDNRSLGCVGTFSQQHHGTRIPPKPALVAGPASISAEPQLRNLQKELVHLVPSTIMRKRVTQKGKIGRPVNAAPGVDEDDDHVAAPVCRTYILTAQRDKGLTDHNIDHGEDEDSDQEQRETGLGLRLPRIKLVRQACICSEVPVAVDKAAQKTAEYD